MLPRYFLGQGVLFVKRLDDMGDQAAIHIIFVEATQLGDQLIDKLIARSCFYAFQAHATFVWLNVLRTTRIITEQLQSVRMQPPLQEP